MATKSQSTSTRNAEQPKPKAKPQAQPKPKTEAKPQERKPPKRVFNTPALIEALKAEPLTIEQLAEAVGIEATPALKRRLSWLTDHDKVLQRSVEGKGKSKVVRFSAANS